MTERSWAQTPAEDTIQLDQLRGAKRDGIFQPTWHFACAVIPLMGGLTLRTVGL
jgi:hypothetical protein